MITRQDLIEAFIFAVMLIAIGGAGLMLAAFGWGIKEYIRKRKGVDRIMNAEKFIVLKENHKGETQELKKYYQTRKQAQTDVKLLNQRAKVTQSGNVYTLKRRIKK